MFQADKAFLHGVSHMVIFEVHMLGFFMELCVLGKTYRIFVFSVCGSAEAEAVAERS